MKILPAFIFLGTAIAALGCASSERMRPARSSLDRAVKYTEVPQRGPERPLSGNAGQEAQVPKSAEVDINSRIHIHIDTDAIKLVDGFHPVDAAALYPGSRAQKITDTLAQLNKLIEARTRAVTAFEKTRGIPIAEMENTAAYKEFDKTVSEMGVQRASFTALAIWSDGTFKEDVDSLFTRSYDRLGPLLQSELNAAQSALQLSIDQANRSAANLRLQAFLIQSDADPLPIHLEGYDLFPQKEVKMKDGFVLDADDRKAFETQYNQTVQIAKQAEKVRTGEMSLNEALMASGSASLKQLAADAADLKPLLVTSWPAIVQSFQQDLQELNASTKKILESHGQSELASLKESSGALSAALSKDLPIADLKKFVDQVESLSQEWGEVAPENFSETFSKAQKLPAQARGLAASFKTARLDQTQKAIDDCFGALKKRPENITEDVWREISEEALRSKSFQNIQTLKKQMQSVQQFIADTRALLRITEINPVKTDIRPKEIKDVPLAEAMDTDIEITRTPRLDNNDIAVSASLQVGQTEVMRSNADFKVRYFGSHSVLAPSVILARPFKIDSGSDKNFQFAPAVAWLYKYYPRDTSKSSWDALARFSQAGIGMHVAFLNQRVQKGPEVGLGAAISFWHDRLVAGAGVNLMNNSKAYFYIGTRIQPVSATL